MGDFLEWTSSERRQFISGGTETNFHIEEQAYLIDIWASCLSLYHQATGLPYRTATHEEVILSTFDSKRTLRLYKRLVDFVEKYLKLMIKNNIERNVIIGSLKAALDEAESALANDQIPLSVIRFETLLSTVHKILLK